MLKSITLFSLVAIALLPTALPSGDGEQNRLASESVYYVAMNGSDANPGSLAQPFKTITKGVTSLQPGDALYVRGGTYVENVTAAIRPGSATAPILFSAYPGERPILKGLLWLKRANYWTVDGLNVTWNTANGPNKHMVKFTDGIGWKLQNSEIWGARSYAGLLVAGSVAGQPAGWSVVDNCIHDTYPSNSRNQDHNIYVNSGVAAGVGMIERNTIFNADNGENIKLGGATTDGGASNVTIRYNTMHRASQNILVWGASHHNSIYGNIIDGANGASAYGNIRGFQLNNNTNIAYSNVGNDAARLIFNYNSSGKVVDGGGNIFPSDPLFDNTTSCDGFNSQSPLAYKFGNF